MTVALSTHANQPLSILVAALGGEGGGVLADWLVQCARASGLAVQATSVPGVAQRTGATSYYVELLREPTATTAATVFSLHPTAATVNMVVASELVEAARVMERGFVSPGTLLVTSTHRTYTTAEKLAPDDGRYDSERALTALRAMASRCVAFDMERIAADHGTVISAVMFGALAGTGGLPWPRAVCEQVIGASGRGAKASLAGFSAAYAEARSQAQAPASAARAKPNAVTPASAPRSEPALAAAIEERAGAWPPSVADVVRHGASRCAGYQNEAYAALYLDHVARLVDAQPHAVPALQEAARSLALWMCFEDVIRVADLKSRRSRFEQLRAEVAARPGELVQVTEHFKPGVDEVSAVLPRALGAALQRLARRRPGLARLHVGLHIRSTSVWGFMLLRAMAALRPLRPRCLRYSEEHQAIQDWLAAMVNLLPRSPDFARVLAELPSVLKGYGDTQVRGREHYARLWQAHVAPALKGKDVALASSTVDFEIALREALHLTPAEPMPRPAAPQVQQIRFHARQPATATSALHNEASRP
jgi:indolepyruvate ferredoxin oxidoreductase, beta subunit